MVAMRRQRKISDTVHKETVSNESSSSTQDSNITHNNAKQKKKNVRGDITSRWAEKVNPSKASEISFSNIHCNDAYSC